MNFKGHFLLALVLFHLLWYPLGLIGYGLVWFWALISALVPDSDLKFNIIAHRSVWTHTIIIPLLLGIWDWELAVFFAVAVAIHGIGDISLSTKGGYYCIGLKSYKFSYKVTTGALVVQFLVMCVLIMLRVII